jgi:hypothetical protein
MVHIRGLFKTAVSNFNFTASLFGYWVRKNVEGPDEA